jgi:hypothetical protein
MGLSSSKSSEGEDDEEERAEEKAVDDLHVDTHRGMVPLYVTDQVRD